LTGRIPRELAAEVKLSLIDPLNLRLCPDTGLHQEEVGALSRAIERQPAFREKAMCNYGKKRQQDADQQDS
jgi:hypothetical protein